MYIVSMMPLLYSFFDISIQNRALPAQINAGQSTIDKSGKYNIQVRIKLDTLTQGNSRDYESFAAGASFVPLIIVILFAATTRMVSYITYVYFMSFTSAHILCIFYTPITHPM